MAWDDIPREKDSVSGDRPFDIIGGLLSKIADTAEKTKGERPTLQEIVDALGATLKMYYDELCCDAMGACVKQVRFVVEEHPNIVSNTNNVTAENPIVAQLYDAFKEMVEVFEEAWERKPRLIELVYPFRYSLENNLADASSIYITDIVVELDREVTSYWWRLTGEDYVLGYEPGEIIERALKEVDKIYVNAFGERPTPQDLADATATALNDNLEEFCADGRGVLIERVDIYLGFEHEPISSTCTTKANQEFVLKLRNAFSDIVTVYQERWGRKPKIRELLRTIRLALVDNLPGYLSVADYLTMTDVKAELGKKFYWWEIGENLLSEKAIDIMRTSLELITQNYEQQKEQYLSLQQLIDAIASTFAMDIETFCSDTKQVYVQRVVAKVDGETIFSNELFKTADEELVIGLYTTFEEIVDIYEDKYECKPKLKEILETIKYAFNNKENNLFIEADKTLTQIIAELYQEYRIPWVLFKHAGIISYEAILKMSNALDSVVATYKEQFGQPPTQQEFLNALTYAFQLYLEQVCSDSNDVNVERVIITFEDNDQYLVSSKEVCTASELLVIAFKNIFEMISLMYNERWNRKPKLQELLHIIRSELESTFCYSVLDAEKEKYIEDIMIE